MRAVCAAVPDGTWTGYGWSLCVKKLYFKSICIHVKSHSNHSVRLSVCLHARNNPKTSEHIFKTFIAEVLQNNVES
jgi:hypothetical protein